MRLTARLGTTDLSVAWMARALGFLFLCGGALSVVWVLIPHAHGHGDAIVEAASLAAVILGLCLFLGAGERLPRVALHGLIAGIQLLVSVAIVATDSATMDNRFFYAWATPYSAFFFGRRAMVGHVAWTGLCMAGSLVLINDPLPVSARSWLMTTGTVVAVGVLVSIVADRMREGQELLRHAALHDPLTGLVNRRGLLVALEDALVEARRSGTSVAVLLVDLDRFKLVNDTHGHRVGDLMLAEVAPRLVRAVRPGDVVGRMGGDEFAVVCRDLDDEAAVECVLARLRLVWAKAVTVGTGTLPISGSIGVVLSRSDDDTAESLLRDADVAMYRAKDVQRGTVAVFDESLRALLNREAALDHALRGAVAGDELALVFQAVVDLSTGGVVGAEALLRWTSADLGPVPPDEFIPIAEDRGLIGEIGAWALDECCRVLAAWRADGVVDPDFHVALNVSGRQLRPGFAGVVDEALARHGLPIDVLCLEITESVLLDDSVETDAAVAELDALGVRLLLDDFGTGFSSLSYLHRFPLAGLKVDKSFVDAVSSSPRQRALVGAMLTMAEALGMAVVAEGVETSEVAETLRHMGCERAQGYLWARPESVEAFPNRVAANRMARDSLVG